MRKVFMANFGADTCLYLINSDAAVQNWIREFHFNMRQILGKQNPKKRKIYFQRWCERIIRAREEEFKNLGYSYQFIDYPTSAVGNLRGVEKILN